MATLATNYVQLSGRLGQKPVEKLTSTGKSYFSFSLAHESFNQFNRPHLSWFWVTVWEATSLVRDLAKGEHVTLSGRLATHYDRANATGYLTVVADGNLERNKPGALPVYNSVTLAGRLGQAPTVQKVGKTEQLTLARFSLANPEPLDRWGASRTNWVQVAAWGELAERVGQANLAKGQNLTVKGALAARKQADSTFYELVAAKLLIPNMANTHQTPKTFPKEVYSPPSYREGSDRFTDSWDSEPDWSDFAQAEVAQTEQLNVPRSYWEMTAKSCLHFTNP